MSYILNALRKSEQDRQKEQSITLENRIQNKQAVAKKKTSIWLVTLVITNLFFLAYFISPFSKKDTHTDKKIEVVSKQKKAVTIEPKIKHETKVVSPPPPVTKKTTKPQHSIAKQIENKRIKKPIINNLPKNKIQEQAQPLEKNEPAEQVKAEIKPVNKPAEISESEKDFPFLSELSYEFQRTVPTLDINVYVYAKEEQDRFIMVNMKKYLSGDQLDSGMTVIEIRIDSLVVEYKNRKFQIKRK